MVNNKFSSDFIIENFKITELSAQKKQTADSAEQVPFSIGVGTSHRIMGIPYFCMRSDPSSFFTEKKVHTTDD